MKKQFIFSSLTFAVLLFFFVFPSSTNAQGWTFKIPPITEYETLGDVITAWAPVIRVVFILTFTAMIVYGGWVRMTSRGDAEKIELSMRIIVAAIVGFVIAVLAPTVVNFILDFFGVDGISEI